MKTILILLMLASTPASTDVSGVWKVEASASGNSVSPICTLKQQGSKLTGSCKSDADSSDITGEVKGKTVMWKYDMLYNGEPITLTFFGKLDPDTEMKGSVQVAPVGLEGEFSAKKQ